MEEMDTLLDHPTSKMDYQQKKLVKVMTVLTVISFLCVVIFMVMFAIVGIKFYSVMDSGETTFKSANNVIKNDIPDQFKFYQEIFISQNRTVTNIEQIVEDTLNHIDTVVEQYYNQNMTQKIVQITDNLNRITKELNMTFIEQNIKGIREDLDAIVKRIG